MNKKSLAGIIIALVLLALSLAAKYLFGDSSAAYILPILSVGLWVLMAIDISLFRHGKISKFTRGVSLGRIISVGVFALFLSVGTILYWISLI